MTVHILGQKTMSWGALLTTQTDTRVQIRYIDWLENLAIIHGYYWVIIDGPLPGALTFHICRYQNIEDLRLPYYSTKNLPHYLPSTAPPSSSFLFEFPPAFIPIR